MFFYHNELYFFDLFVFIDGEPSWKCVDHIVSKSSFGLCDEEAEYLMSVVFDDLRGGKQASMYDQTFVIYLSEWRDRSIDYGTLSHEIYHTVHDVMRSRGVKFSEGSEESFAYLMGHLTTVVLNHIFGAAKEGAKPVLPPTHFDVL
jgi:hypothetical protein